MYSKLLRKVLLACLILIVGYQAKAQPLSTFTVTESVGSFTSVQGVDVMTTRTDDGASGLLPIGFSFPFDNQTFTQFCVTSNGQVRLGATMATGANERNAVPGNVSYNNLFALYQFDGEVGTSCGYLLSGSSPNQVLTVYWKGYDYYNPDNTTAELQLKLYQNGKFEFVYGPGCTNIGDNAARIYVNGNFSGVYKNITPGTPSTISATNSDANVNGSTNDYLVSGKTYTFSGYPQITAVTPIDYAVLQIGQSYQSPNLIQPSVTIANYQTIYQTYIQYKISGPGEPGASNPNFQVIYTAAKESEPTNINIPITANGTKIITEASGIAALLNPENNGGIDLSQSSTSIKGGVYKAEAKLLIPSLGYTSDAFSSSFNIAYQRDIAITEIIHPLQFKKFETVAGHTVSQISVKNVGVDAVQAFDVCAVYFKKDVAGVYQPIQYDTVRWKISPDTLPLESGQVATIYFPDIRFQSFGDYKAQYSVNYINYDSPLYVDMELSNNVYPRVGAPEWVFKVANSVELSVLNVITPNNKTKYYRYVPLHPEVAYFNSGMIDTSTVTATISIYWLDNGVRQPTGYANRTTVVQDIPFGDFGLGRFPISFTPEHEGTYVVETSILFPNDPIPGNNTKIDTFRVEVPMSGTYTIGTRFLDSVATNFATFKDAENEIYKRGIKGDITFELTDASYTVGDPNAKDVAAMLSPAIDFSSAIAGAREVSYLNPIPVIRTIKFVPYRDKMSSRNSVVINIQSGIGFFLGQSHQPSNPNSAVYKILPTEVKKLANPDGYFVIDGGDNKSIRFNMNTASNLRVPLYLGSGASNVTVKNCIFTDGSPTPSTAASLPVTNCSSESVFSFADDARSNSDTSTYSTAIMMRSIVAFDKVAQLNVRNLDSLSNNNNLIANNEISGFTYGVVSLGIGVLLESRAQLLKTYYNQNNRIINNKIFDVKRAGIVVGYDSNTSIKNNVIYNINGVPTKNSSAGIIVGGEQGFNEFGYNSIDITIDGNEINNITGNQAVYGIKIEQFLAQYPFGGSLTDYPKTDENVRIINNMIWGLKAKDANTDIFGIRLYSTRSTLSTRSNYLNSLYPLLPRYKVRNSSIINNTVVIEDDNPSLANQGIIAAVALQNVTRTRLINNAIALKDTQLGSNCKIATGVLLQSDFPQAPNFISDRNAYEISPVGSVYRLVENDSRDRILEEGDIYDYKTIFQWQNWTQQDLNSKFGVFTSDMTKDYTSKGYPTYRVTLSPQTPISSILNNFGEILFGDLNRDIDDNVRGRSNDRFDIGACEFLGRFYSEELSVENILEPRKYQSGNGLFSDAEYIMQLPPYQVKTLVTNNGTLSRGNVPVRMELFLEKPIISGGVELVKIDSLVQFIAIAPWESKTLVYNIPTSNNKLFPRTYQQMIDSGYCTLAQVPAQFLAMKNNVTPRYKINITLLISESKSDNDVMSKYVRYYVPKTNINMLVTGENMAVNLNGVTNTDIIAGRLNSDSLRKNMSRLGWESDTAAAYRYDVFDRSGWERRTVDYSLYKTVLWSDGNDSLSRYQVADLRKFLNNPIANEKRNLVIGSQEMSRELVNTEYVQYDSSFVKDVLRGLPADPNTPIANGYSGYKVLGSSVGQGFEETISNTQFVGDTKALPGNLKLVPNGDAVARQAYKYMTVRNGILDSTMGIASTSLTMNLVYLAVDWRHWKNGERMLRSINDFLMRNGGNVVPVELSAFEALKYENRVELNWNTVYELNSDRFEVEKATKTAAGVSYFSTIETVPASNITSVATEYGPVKDYNVTEGNTYIYRLKIIDRDGSFSYGPEAEVSYSATELAITKVTPNPVSNTSIINYVVPQDGNISVKLFDANGTYVKTLFDGATNAGAMSMYLETLGLSSGAYTLVITDGISTATRQIRIQK